MDSNSANISLEKSSMQQSKNRGGDLSGSPVPGSKMTESDIYSNGVGMDSISKSSPDKDITSEHSKGKSLGRRQIPKI